MTADAGWPTDPREFFLRALPARLAASAAALADRSSPGSLTIVLEDPPASFGIRLVEGSLVVTEGVPADSLARVSTTTETFHQLVERALPGLATKAAQARPEAWARLLGLEQQHGAALQALRGSVVVVAADGPTEHRITVAFGPDEPAPAAPRCVLRVALADVLDLVAGRLQPIQLMLGGQLVIEGDAQIVMALLGVLA